MHFPPLLEAKVVKREKRFRLYVEIDGKPELAHLPNPGRLEEIIYPGARVFLKRAESEGRKTKLEAVLGLSDNGVLVSLNASLANSIFLEYLEKVFPNVKNYVREYTFEGSRFDFLLDDRILVEVKSCTLVRNGLGLFPDAPTLRGTKHIETLLKWPGEKALVFVVQREDALKVMPNYEMDRAFGLAMRQAFKKLDYVKAFTVKVSPAGITFKELIPVVL